MKRGFVVAVGGAAIVIAGLSGCSSDEKKSESPATSAEATTGAGDCQRHSSTQRGRHQGHDRWPGSERLGHRRLQRDGRKHEHRDRRRRDRYRRGGQRGRFTTVSPSAWATSTA